ncbi:hypothetical protein LTR05_008667 [Lithohypha guttulata]|uniref:S-adenosyl-L-methionine-dependent methyltransferase n=1 Tax=Lithohypha guttulata TaxID=1690604 RepID=A0AAN7Q7A2_9EURO|nr:hypothetical protein LTR05_008667 [Lithohypha guttulata]
MATAAPNPLKSGLTSLSSSAYDYQYENGRRYHAYHPGQYLLPNDENEQERLDAMHYVFQLVLDPGLCCTELNNPLKILDVGTGTGIWAIDMGDLYPSAQVIGTDLSPIQPNWIPPNVSFQVDDATDPWAFPKESFDFIHARSLAGSIQDWPALIRKAYEHLKPGGRIEFSEARMRFRYDDNTYSQTSTTRWWMSEFDKIARENNLDFDAFPRFGNSFRQAGFTSVVEGERPCPIGLWPKHKKLKEVGGVFKAQLIGSALDSYSLALFTRLGGWSGVETHAFLAEVRKELAERRMHLYTHCSFAVGQKPVSCHR